MDELKRQSDWQLLYRVDENVKAIKSTLDSYPLPAISEKLSNNCIKMEAHLKSHNMFWYKAIVPLAIAIIVLFVGLWIKGY